jgi:TonB family protein
MILTPMVIAAAPTCAAPNRAAYVSHAATFEYDGMADFPQYPLDVLVDVNLDAKGHPTSVHITKSSGNTAADREAVLLARRSTYAPKIVHCSATSGALIFHARIPGSSPSPKPK